MNAKSNSSTTQHNFYIIHYSQENVRMFQSIDFILFVEVLSIINF